MRFTGVQEISLNNSVRTEHMNFLTVHDELSICNFFLRSNSWRCPTSLRSDAQMPWPMIYDDPAISIDHEQNRKPAPELGVYYSASSPFLEETQLPAGSVKEVGLSGA